MVFDSKFDAYKGVVLYVRVIDGRIKPGMKIKMMATNAEFEVTEVGVFKPNLVNVDSLEVGQVGFLLQQSKMLKTHVSGIQLLMPIIRQRSTAWLS